MRHFACQFTKFVLTISLMMIFAVAPAQQVVSLKAGVLQFIQGDVFLDGKPVQLPKNSYAQVGKGQKLNTKQGKAELLLSFHAYLRMGEDSSVSMQDNRIGDTQIALEQGPALIEVLPASAGDRIRVNISDSVVEIQKAGLYRLNGSSGEVRVYNGEAVAKKDGQKAAVTAGKMVNLKARLAPDKFDAGVADSLHSWAAQRSFSLFIVTAETRKQMHWTPLSLGWLRNSSYRMSFYSEFYYWQWVRDQAKRRFEELLASYTYLQRNPSSKRDSGVSSGVADLEEEIKAAYRAVQSAEEQIKKSDPAGWKAKPEAGQKDGTVTNVPAHYTAAQKRF